jgi:hypothetical protein
MKVSPHPDSHQVSAQEVRAVLDHASQPLTRQQWANTFGVTVVTIQAWRTKGFWTGLWTAPKLDRWEGLKAEAAKNIRAILAVLAHKRRLP